MEWFGKRAGFYLSMQIKEFVRTKAVTTTNSQDIYGEKTFYNAIRRISDYGIDAYFYARQPVTGAHVGFGIGSGGWNRGIYDLTEGRWMIYYNSNNQLVLDGGATVGSATTPIYLNAGVPTACSASLSTTSISPLSTEKLSSLSLDEVKEHRNAELTSAFNEHISGSFTTTSGYNMQFSPTAILSLQCGIATNSTYLTQADNTTVYDLTTDILQAVLTEMQQAYSACHARKQELRAKINAAEDKDSVVAIEFEWPV